MVGALRQRPGLRRSSPATIQQDFGSYTFRARNEKAPRGRLMMAAGVAVNDGLWPAEE